MIEKTSLHTIGSNGVHMGAYSYFIIFESSYRHIVNTVSAFVHSILLVLFIHVHDVPVHM